MSLSIDAASWAIHLTPSAGREAEVARKLAKVDGRGDDEDDTVTETVWLLGFVITKPSAVSSSTLRNISKVIIMHARITNLNRMLPWMPCILATNSVY